MWTSNSSSKWSGAWNSIDAATRGKPRLEPGVHNRQPGRAPERMLGFLHVAEELAEMDDAGQVRLGKVHPPVVAMLADRHGQAVATSISAARAALLVLVERVEERRQVGEDVADERVDDERVQVRVDLEELAKAEGEIVEGAHELAEAHDGAPLPRVVLVEVRGASTSPVASPA